MRQNEYSEILETVMRYLILLSFLLVGCETFNWGDLGKKGAVKHKNHYCNVPHRYMIFRTSAANCRALGGHQVDDSEADQLDAYYQDLNST